MTPEQEARAIANLQAKGYYVVVCAPFAKTFSQKYLVYLPSERLLGKVIYVDDLGNEKNR